jgi:LysR family glycine cleavage system transcriptional activator
VIQWGDEAVLGVNTEPFLESHRYPVISPALKQQENVQSPKDLLRLRLLHDETDDAWDEWFTAAGVTPPESPRGPFFPNCELASQGVSLAYHAMVSGTLATGRLERLFDTVTLPIVIYSIAYPAARSEDSMITEFRDWLFAELERDNADKLRFTAAE